MDDIVQTDNCKWFAAPPGLGDAPTTWGPGKTAEELGFFRHRVASPFHVLVWIVGPSVSKLAGRSSHQRWHPCDPISPFLWLFVWGIVSGDITVKGHDISDGTIGVLKRRYDKRGIGYQPAGDTRHSRIPESNEDTLLTLELLWTHVLPCTVIWCIVDIWTAWQQQLMWIHGRRRVTIIQDSD